MEEKDIFDKAVDYFIEHPEEAVNAWLRPLSHRYGYLFGFLGKSRYLVDEMVDEKIEHTDYKHFYGCPAMVKLQTNSGGTQMFHAFNDEITEAIVADEEMFGAVNVSDWDNLSIPENVLRRIGHWQRVNENARRQAGVEKALLLDGHVRS